MSSPTGESMPMGVDANIQESGLPVDSYNNSIGNEESEPEVANSGVTPVRPHALPQIIQADDDASTAAAATSVVISDQNPLLMITEVNPKLAVDGIQRVGNESSSSPSKENVRNNNNIDAFAFDDPSAFWSAWSSGKLRECDDNEHGDAQGNQRCQCFEGLGSIM